MIAKLQLENRMLQGGLVQSAGALHEVLEDFISNSSHLDLLPKCHSVRSSIYSQDCVSTIRNFQKNQPLSHLWKFLIFTVGLCGFFGTGFPVNPIVRQACRAGRETVCGVGVR